MNEDTLIDMLISDNENDVSLGVAIFKENYSEDLLNKLANSNKEIIKYKSKDGRFIFDAPLGNAQPFIEMQQIWRKREWKRSHYYRHVGNKGFRLYIKNELK